MFENKVLRKIFGAKLHTAELRVFYPSPNIIKNLKSSRLGYADGRIILKWI